MNLYLIQSSENIVKIIVHIITWVLDHLIQFFNNFLLIKRHDKWQKETSSDQIMFSFKWVSLVSILCREINDESFRVKQKSLSMMVKSLSHLSCIISISNTTFSASKWVNLICRVRVDTLTITTESIKVNRSVRAILWKSPLITYNCKKLKVRESRLNLSMKDEKSGFNDYSVEWRTVMDPFSCKTKINPWQVDSTHSFIFDLELIPMISSVSVIVWTPFTLETIVNPKSYTTKTPTVTLEIMTAFSFPREDCLFLILSLIWRASCTFFSMIAECRDSAWNSSNTNNKQPSISRKRCSWLSISLNSIDAHECCAWDKVIHSKGTIVSVGRWMRVRVDDASNTTQKCWLVVNAIALIVSS